LSFCYLPIESPHLRQGEIIENLFEFIPRVAAGETTEAEKTTKLEKVSHPLVVVVSQDCDLESDYGARLGDREKDKLLVHVLLCDLFTMEEVRFRSNLKSDLFKRVRQNQDERYHHFLEGPLTCSSQRLPDLYADFKLTFSQPVDFLYWLISSGGAARRAIVPEPYLRDFIHRLHSFLGRVPVPPPAA
jgi:hypothetical protein